MFGTAHSNRDHLVDDYDKQSTSRDRLNNRNDRRARANE
jgi:hypothetical protein